MSNFRKLYVRFGDLERMMNFFQSLSNWKVKKENIAGYDYIVFEGYGDRITFPIRDLEKGFIGSSNVIKQDAKVNETTNHFQLKDDLLYILCKELDEKYDLIFHEDCPDETSMRYDDSLSFSLSLSKNDFKYL